MTDEELRYRMERVTERMAGADDTNEVVVSVALMRELFGRLEQMQAKIDAVTDERDELQTQVTVLEFDNGELSRAQRRISRLQAKIAEIES